MLSNRIPKSNRIDKDFLVQAPILVLPKTGEDFPSCRNCCLISKEGINGDGLLAYTGVRYNLSNLLQFRKKILQN